MFKIPVSCLVVIYSGANVLILERAGNAGFWQSVTGGWEEGESLLQTAEREVFEETGLQSLHGGIEDCHWASQYWIYPQWRHRYAPGVTINTEHVFALALEECLPPALAPQEHTAFKWLPWQEAAEQVFSPSNKAAIEWICGKKKCVEA